MKLGSTQNLISAYAALATLTTGAIAYDSVTRRNHAEPAFAERFAMESVTHAKAGDTMGLTSAIDNRVGAR